MTDPTIPRGNPKGLPLWRRTWDALTTEVVGIHPRLHLYNSLVSLLPSGASGELRARLLRLIGFEVGAGTRVNGPLTITGSRGLSGRLAVGPGCTIESGCVFDLSETLHIDERVTVEPGVMILTSTHELDFPQHRAGNVILSPVSVGAGAWLRARSVILPGVKIGAGAVVEAGAVVNKDVEPNTRVGGIPATKLSALGET